MCDLVSWVETLDGILYCTDKEIFSARGQEIIKIHEANHQYRDIIGHGYIESYYELTHGIFPHRECTMFWDDHFVRYYANEFITKVSTAEGFMATYGKSISAGYIEFVDLMYIVRRAPDEYGDVLFPLAVKSLLTTTDWNPKNSWVISSYLVNCHNKKEHTSRAIILIDTLRSLCTTGNVIIYLASLLKNDDIPYEVHEYVFKLLSTEYLKDIPEDILHKLGCLSYYNSEFFENAHRFRLSLPQLPPLNERKLT